MARVAGPDVTAVASPQQIEAALSSLPAEVAEGLRKVIPLFKAGLPFNLDSWDGYPVAREVLLSTAAQRRQRLVVLAGDTHNAWHSDLTLRSGVKVGEEFATPSVSSPGLEDYLAAVPPAQVKQIFESVVDDLQWMDPSRRGFLKMTFTPQEARGEWVFVDRIDTRSYSVSGTERRVYRPT